MSIVQSSGMGKSCAIDELSKKHLVIPLCLQKDSEGKVLNSSATVLQVLTVAMALGFPPSDDNVHDWLLNGKGKMEAFTHAGAFLCALFTILLHHLKEINVAISSLSDDEPNKSLVAKFWLLMTEGQTFASHGQPCRQFYAEVINLAKQVCPLL